MKTLDLTTKEKRATALEEITKKGQNYEIEDSNHMWEFNGLKEGKTVSLIGLVHGNETVGLHAVSAIMQIAINQGVFRGNLKLILANVEAFIEGVRFIDTDMNRSFDHQCLSESKEVKRAQEIEPHLIESDISLDIHSTRAPSPLGAFIVFPGEIDEYSNLIHTLMIPKVLVGEGLFSPDGVAFATDIFTKKHGGTGLTIEAGWQEDEKTLEVIESVIKALKLLEIFEPNPQSETRTDDLLQIWDTYVSVRSNETVRWVHPCKNFNKVKNGTTLAITKSGQEIKATAKNPDAEIFIIFPKKEGETEIPGGTELCLLAHKIN